MMKIRLVGVVVGCLLFPAQLAKFHRVAVTEFPDKRMGVSIRYEGRGRAEAFVYDLGFADIPTGTDSEVVRKAFAQSEAGIERLLTSKPASDGRKFLESTPVVETDGRQATLLAALYTWTVTGSDGRGGPMATCILMTGVKNKIVKLLYTAPAPEPASTQRDLKEFVVGFLEANPKERGSFLVEKKAP